MVSLIGPRPSLVTQEDGTKLGFQFVCRVMFDGSMRGGIRGLAEVKLELYSMVTHERHRWFRTIINHGFNILKYIRQNHSALIFISFKCNTDLLH